MFDKLYILGGAAFIALGLSLAYLCYRSSGPAEEQEVLEKKTPTIQTTSPTQTQAGIQTPLLSGNNPHPTTPVTHPRPQASQTLDPQDEVIDIPERRELPRREEPTIFFAVMQDDENCEIHRSFKLAKRDLLSRKESGNANSLLTLTIQFPSKLITDFCTIEFFRSWLSRVGDYIFVRRVLLIPDLKQVLLNPDFARVPADEIHKRGNIIFDDSEPDTWSIQIRGLHNWIDEIETVASLILRALTEPHLMADFSGFAFSKFSCHLNKYLESLGECALEPKDASLADNLAWITIYSVHFQQESIKTNLQSFLPLVHFCEAPNIKESQRLILEEESKSFLNDFCIEVLPNIKSKPKCDKLALLALRDESCSVHQDAKCYGWLVERLRSWTTATKLTTIIKQSLFKE